MRKVAVFGNAGGGKSTLARRLAELTKLPLYVIDLMQFAPGGAPVPQEDFLRAHADLLQQDKWIIDGYGSTALSRERFAAADTLIFIDLPIFTHYRWITKRFVKGLFSTHLVGRKAVPCGAAPFKATACFGCIIDIWRQNTESSWLTRPLPNGCITSDRPRKSDHF